MVFPARPAGIAAARETFADQGLDVSLFLDRVENQDTLFFPVTQSYGSITALVRPIVDEIYIGSRNASTLTEVNQTINEMLSGGQDAAFDHRRRWHRPHQ